ncbi:MAG: toll/interleukin-1 receptor domain-containing protein [Hyphomonadaceae bacterium]|nr:toll/interleukin-1 receptor domain-containing protein [Hyphomonadaceae bacterium]
MSGVFISYRRGDAAASAGRLSDHLRARLGADQVFMDVDGIEPGVDFHKVISDNVSQCDALIAVIGPDWLSDRLHEENDFVRIEISAGLERDVRVIPVLVDGAKMPPAERLPDSLKGLARRNAAEVSHMRFSDDAGRLADVLMRIVSPDAGEMPVQAPPAATPGAPGMSARMLGLLDESFKRFEVDQQLHVNEIPVSKFANAAPKCGLPEGERVIALVDFTVMKNANDAMLVTESGLRVHHSSADFSQPQYISYGDLLAHPIEKHGWWQIRLGGTRITVSGGPDRDVLIDFLSAIRAALT